MAITDIENQVHEGIRKTIRRFRLRPYEFFTEAELHTSLRQDIRAGHSKIMTARPGNLAVTLVHQEYPTNFRYSKSGLLRVGQGGQITPGYRGIPLTETDLNCRKGDRGHFDLAVLSPDFLDDRLPKAGTSSGSLEEGLRHVINKRISLAQERFTDNPRKHRQELLYAIEVKYIHLFNAGHSNMLREVAADCEKLHLAHAHSGGFVKPICIVFCSSKVHKGRGKKAPLVDQLAKLAEGQLGSYKVPKDVALIFVRSFLSEGDEKSTPRTIVSPAKGGESWVGALRRAVK
ncbi:MAG: hypothetical protein QGI43_01070 [Gemmatimonadota bacterium]|nr:hypothetical protein [Gemmatimonadota bacterium]